MTHHLRFTSCPAVLLLAAILPAPCRAENTAQPPNIVLIMCDDMGFSDLGCYGSEIATPCIDGLAREGMRFTQFYNNAKCTTTRASLITGLYPRRGKHLLRDNMTTIAEVLQGAGYHTALSGKWHLGHAAPDRPGDRGFDEYFGLLDGCCNSFDPSLPDPDFKGGKIRWFAKNDERITTFPKDFYTTDAFSDYAIDVIQRNFAHDDSHPLFLHVCYTAPHYPLQARPEDIARYQGRYSEGWTVLRHQRRQRQIAMGLIDPRWKLSDPGREVTAWENAADKEWQDLRMAVYAAMIDRMDQGIGRILSAIDDAGVRDNTVVMFLSDNGGCAETPGGNDPKQIPGPKEFYAHCGPGWAYAQNTPFRRYKQWVHEGGISTPLIVRYPGTIKAGSLTRQVGHIVDLLPTCAALAKADYPTTRDGVDVLPTEGLDLSLVFQNQPREGHDWLFWEWAGNRAVRHGQWKLCWDRTVSVWELYDVEADRTEMNDLAASQPDRVQKMSERWFDWARRTGLNTNQRSDDNH